MIIFHRQYTKLRSSLSSSQSVNTISLWPSVKQWALNLFRVAFLFILERLFDYSPSPLLARPILQGFVFLTTSLYLYMFFVSWFVFVFVPDSFCFPNKKRQNSLTLIFTMFCNYMTIGFHKKRKVFFFFSRVNVPYMFNLCEVRSHNDDVVHSGA